LFLTSQASWLPQYGPNVRRPLPKWGLPLILDDTGDYCVTFDEAGLGKTVTYTITAGEGTTFTFRCFTKSGNKPQEAPNSVSGSNDLFETTVHPKSGRFMGTLCLQPQQDGASCQGGGLVLKLIAVDYKGVVFCDSTNNLCFEMPNMSATFPDGIPVSP
jgi:hypothetical protein